jgi:hypothetical protein
MARRVRAPVEEVPMVTRFWIVAACGLLFVCLAGTAQAVAQPVAPFVMGGVTAAPGTFASGDLKVPEARVTTARSFRSP